jgi:Na+-transporting NADH:ubiquinone oxidoreductase subunit NqrF
MEALVTVKSTENSKACGGNHKANWILEVLALFTLVELYLIYVLKVAVVKFIKIKKIKLNIDVDNNKGTMYYNIKLFWSVIYVHTL